MLDWLVNERAIEPHIPAFDKSGADRTLSREDFAYDQQSDVYICPAGKVLASTGTVVNDGTALVYRAGKHACDAYELKHCCPKMPARKVPRSIHAPAALVRGLLQDNRHKADVPPPVGNPLPGDKRTSNSRCLRSASDTFARTNAKPYSKEIWLAADNPSANG